MIYLSRIAVELVSPLNISLVCLLISFVLIYFRYRKTSLVTLGISIFILLIFGYGIGIQSIIKDIENENLPLNEQELLHLATQNIPYVVILGSGHVSDKRLPGNSQLGGGSLFRLVEGIRIHKSLKDSVLIICGGAVVDPVPNATVAGSVADLLGIPRARVIIKDQPKDTIEEAEVVLPLVGNRPFILVSSALHMPRALKIFKQMGMHPIPSTTDFIFKQHKVQPPSVLLPSSTSLSLSRRLIYEWIGQKWSTIKLSLKSCL